MSKVNMAVKNGMIVKPVACEICGHDPSKQTVDRWGFPLAKPIGLVAHHYLGYHHPTDVWWVCRSCNAKLAHCHDGRFKTVQEYRDYLVTQEIQRRAEIDAFNATLSDNE